MRALAPLDLSAALDSLSIQSSCIDHSIDFGFLIMTLNWFPVYLYLCTKSVYLNGIFFQGFSIAWYRSGFRLYSLLFTVYTTPLGTQLGSNSIGQHFPNCGSRPKSGSQMSDNWVAIDVFLKTLIFCSIIIWL